MRHSHLLRFTGLLTFLLLLNDVDAQRRGGRNGFFQPQRPGALELSGAALLSWEASIGDLLVHPAAELTWIGRSPGPLHTGIRLGLGQLDRTLSPGENEGTPVEGVRTRLLMPEVSSVLRLAPFQGGFQPFLEGELGLAATVLDESSFDAEGQRIAYRIPAYDATAHYGWAAGIRLKMGEGAFLALRYGKRFGGTLDLHEADPNPTLMPAQLDGERSRASLGFSFAL